MGFARVPLRRVLARCPRLAWGRVDCPARGGRPVRSSGHDRARRRCRRARALPRPHVRVLGRRNHPDRSSGHPSVVTYFEDGSPYRYGPGASPLILNAGWLDASEPFSTGAVPPEFLDRLFELAQHPVNLYRGYHICNICPSEDVTYTLSPGGLRMREFPPACAVVSHRGAEATIRGNGEVRVAETNGTRWAAPALVFHYVTAHQYRPPQGFVDAVLTGAVLPDPQQAV